MKIELDTVLRIITLDGVKIALELLKVMANPDPKKLYSMHRGDDGVTFIQTSYTVSELEALYRRS